MTIMKSPGQKLKTPKKEANTPSNIKARKSKGPATPSDTSKPQTPMLSKQKTPLKSMTPKQVGGTPRSKTPNGGGTPKPKTPRSNGTPISKPTNAAGTPKPKIQNAVTPKSQTPKSVKKAGQKSPNGKGPVTPGPKLNTPSSKVPKGGKGPQTPAGTKAVQIPSGKKEVKVGNSPVVKDKQSRKRSASSAGLDKGKDPQIAFKALRVYNLPPQMQGSELELKLRELMEPRGEIEKIKHDASTKSIQIVFTKAEDARAGKKLNGFLLGGRHLTIVHHDDRDLPEDNRVVLSNVPTDLSDEDVWSIFGSCGKILAIHMNRDWRTKKVQRCFVTFDTKKGADMALSSKKDIKGKQIIVKRASKDGKMFPIENTVYILNLGQDVSENDVQNFIGKSVSTSGVAIVEGRKRYAMVHLTNVSDVSKALALDGKELNGKQVKLERHRKSILYVKSKPAQVVSVKQEKDSKPNTSQEVPAKKLKQNNGKVMVKEEPLDDEDESEEDESEDEDVSGDDDTLLAAFQGKLQQLKSSGVKVEQDDSEEEDDDEEEGEEEEDDDENDDDDDEDDDDEDDDDEDDEDDDEDE